MNIALATPTLRRNAIVFAIWLGVFITLGGGFFLLNGQSPLTLFWEMLVAAFGDAFAWSETLVKTAPILLCAMAAALPARLGLVSIGADGQMYFGALIGTAVVLALPNESFWVLTPLMLGGAILGGAIYGAIPGILKGGLGVNETISTLMLNYIAALLVDYVVHGPWKDPGNLGWPATISFPEAAVLPTFFDTRAHAGLLIGVVAALVLYVLTTYSRWGLSLNIMQGNARLAQRAGLSFRKNVVVVMAIAGLLAGLAGIAETSVIQGRLQSGISSGYGYTGFLVAWLAGPNFLRIIVISILMGGLLASADMLQMVAHLPSTTTYILQGLLFGSALAVGAVARRRAMR